MKILNGHFFKTGNIFKKGLLWASIMYSMIYALNAPYLIDVNVSNDSSVELSWRNNDISTQGFVILRKNSDLTEFAFLDSIKSATTLAYIDQKELLAATTYTYRILAYDDSTLSDTSNSLTVTTPKHPLKTPSISIDSWDFDTSKSVRVSIFDSSISETKYVIYKDEGFSGNFAIAAEIISEDPSKLDIIEWFDTTVAFNKWYNYKVAIFENTDSSLSAACSTCTFHFIQSETVPILRFFKKSEFPISLTDGISAKAGDSIIIKETNSPSEQYSVFNVKDAANPKFDGYIDSTKLLLYPLNTLLPVFLKFNTSNKYQWNKALFFNNNLVVATEQPSNYNRSMYRIQDDSLALVNTIRYRDGNGYTVVYLNDSVAAFRSYIDVMRPQMRVNNLSLCKVSSMGISLLPWPIEPWASEPEYKNIFGISGNFFISTSNISDTVVLHVYDLFLSRVVYLRSKTSSPDLDDAICEIMPHGYLCIKSSIAENGRIDELYLRDSRNPNSFYLSSVNNAVYRNTVDSSNTLQNLFIDTLNHYIYLLYTHKASIIEYKFDLLGSKQSLIKPTVSHSDLTIMRTSSGIMIKNPFEGKTANLCIYKIDGRLLDKFVITSGHVIRWKPNDDHGGCYIAVFRSGARTYRKMFVKP